MNRKVGLVILYIIFTVITLTYIYVVSSDYVYVINMYPYFAILITSIVAALFTMNKINDIKYAKRFKFTITLCYILLAIVLIVFNLLIPNYTFTKAENIIKTKEQVTIVKNTIGQKTIASTSNGQLYLITAVRNDKEIYYSFDPYNGEFFLLDR